MSRRSGAPSLPPATCHPPPGQGARGSEYAELVAFRVHEHGPGLLALSDVRSRGSQREQPLDLGVSIVRSEVEVQAVLRRLRLGDRHEQEPRKSIRGGSDLELVWVVVHDDPAERVSPPEPEGTRVVRIHDGLLPLEAHEPIVEISCPGCASISSRNPSSETGFGAPVVGHLLGTERRFVLATFISVPGGGVT